MKQYKLNPPPEFQHDFPPSIGLPEPSEVQSGVMVDGIPTTVFIKSSAKNEFAGVSADHFRLDVLIATGTTPDLTPCYLDMSTFDSLSVAEQSIKQIQSTVQSLNSVNDTNYSTSNE